MNQHDYQLFVHCIYQLVNNRGPILFTLVCMILHIMTCGHIL